MNPRRAICLAALALPLLCACDATTAGQRVTDPTLRPMAQATQFYQQALATQRAGDATVQVNAQRLAATASIATQTQVAVLQQGTAQAAAAVYTQQAVATRAARDATAQAVRDADATATIFARIRVDATTTKAVEVAAASTAAVRATETTIRLESASAEAARARLVNGALSALILTGAALAIVALLIGWRVGVANLRKQGMVQRYGAGGSQAVVVIEDGAGGWALLDPLTGFALGAQVRDGRLVTAPLTPASLALLENAQKVQAIAAEHAPFPPVKPEIATKRAFALGPLSTSLETTPAAIERAPSPALPGAPAPGRPAEPQTQWAIDKSGSNSLAERNLQDLEDWIRIGWSSRDLSRAAWVGKTMPGTGRRVSKGYWQATMKLFEQVHIVACDGNGEAHPAVSLEEALDAFGLFTPQLVDPVTTRPDARQLETTSSGT